MEAHNAIGARERYHAPLRRIYLAMRKSYPRIGQKLALRLCIKAIYDIMGSKGLVPSLPVFSVIPSLPVINKALPDQRDGMAVLFIARAEISPVTEELRISQASYQI